MNGYYLNTIDGTIAVIKNQRDDKEVLKNISAALKERYRDDIELEPKTRVVLYNIHGGNPGIFHFTLGRKEESQQASLVPVLIY